MNWYKTTYQDLSAYVNFKLKTDETITTITNTEYDGVSITSLAISESKVTFDVEDGNNKSEYVVIVTVQTSLSRTLKAFCTVVVDDDLVQYYGSIYEANLYFGDRLNSESWMNASSSDRRKALIESSKSIDLFDFLGSKTDDEQELEFPRNGDTVVPKDVEYAAYECAVELLNGKTFDSEFEKYSVAKDEFESVRTEYSKDPVVFGTYSNKAYVYLIPYLRDRRSVRFTRVS